jgi:CheY-like chemotaxis protein
VLLVEDEPSLARMSEKRLQSLGYRVTVETDPLRALKTFGEREAEFDLMISDHLMPGMVGLDLARAVHNIRPDLPIVLLTGFIEDLPEEMLRTAGVRRVIGKPTSLQSLGTALHEILRGTPAGQQGRNAHVQ